MVRFVFRFQRIPFQTGIRPYGGAALTHRDCGAQRTRTTYTTEVWHFCFGGDADVYDRSRDV